MSESIYSCPYCGRTCVKSRIRAFGPEQTEPWCSHSYAGVQLRRAGSPLSSWRIKMVAETNPPQEAA